jgi:drug/metabolite transporter (DMT)-like permease
MLSWLRRRSVLTPLCLATLYAVWGSTYLAIRVAVGVLPPFEVGAIRFLSAGVLLFAALQARGAPAPTLREWRSCAGIGFLMMSVGLGGASLAMTHVSSGVAALVFGSVPLWTALLERAFGGRLRGREALGMLFGFATLAFVATRGELRADTAGAVELAVAAGSYSLGCVLSRRLPQPGGPMSVAAQMIVAGAILAVASLARGEHPPTHVPLAPILALAHLVLLGSIAAYSALNHLLRTERPALATSYAFVNPIVAVALGVLLGGEHLGTTAKAPPPGSSPVLLAPSSEEPPPRPRVRA